MGEKLQNTSYILFQVNKIGSCHDAQPISNSYPRKQIFIYTQVLLYHRIKKD